MTRKQRLQALEHSLGREKYQTALVLYLTSAPTPDQQAAIEEARQKHRPVLVIRSENVDFGQSDEIVIVQEE